MLNFVQYFFILSEFFVQFPIFLYFLPFYPFVFFNDFSVVPHLPLKLSLFAV